MITLGMVGCAHCHTPWILGVLKANKNAKVKAVYDHDPKRAGSCGQVLGCPVVADPAQIWNDPSIHGVFILSETNRHEQDIAAAVAARKPVFVEKPLATTAAGALISAKALYEAKLLFMMGYRTRSEGIFIFLRDQIRQGHFGKVTRIRYINCHDGALKGGFGPEHRWMYDPQQAGGGVFLDLGTHALDALLWLMGEEVVSGTSLTGEIDPLSVKKRCDDFGEGLLRFKSGAIGSLAAGWVDVDQPVRCVISGTEGHAHVTDGKLYFKSSHVPGADGKTLWTQVPPDRPLVFDVFIDALSGQAGADYITPLEAAQVCAVQEALAIGARENSWVKPQWITG